MHCIEWFKYFLLKQIYLKSFILVLVFKIFCVKLALFKRDFLHDAVSKLGISWSQKRAENLRSSKLSLHASIDASKPEIFASERYRAFFLGHPVYI